MTWWDEQAVRWQERNRHGEAEQTLRYDDDDVRRATVHTREDITMVVAYLSALNRQAAMLGRWLTVIALVVIYIAVRLSL